MSGLLYDYSQWPNFSHGELVCQHTGLENPNIDSFTSLMNWVQGLRDSVGVPFKVTSCYRHETHPYEVKKLKPGMHNIAAIDIQVPIEHAHELVRLAFQRGFTGIGWKMHGAQKNRFIHLDRRVGPQRIWTYP